MSSFQDKILKEIDFIESEKNVDTENYMVYLVRNRLDKSVSNYSKELSLRSEVLKTNNTMKVARKLIKVNKDV